MNENPTPEPVDADARTWGMVAHLSSLSGYVVPFGHVLGPWVVHLAKQDLHPFVRANTLAALNFNLNCLLAAILCIPLCFVCIGVPLLIMIGLAQIVFTIVAGIKAGDAVVYDYPMVVRLVR